MQVSRSQLVGIMETVPDGVAKAELSRFLVREPGREFVISLENDVESQTWGWNIDFECYIADVGEIPALDQLGRDMGEMRAAVQQFKKEKKAEVKAVKKLLLGVKSARAKPELPHALAWDLNVSEDWPVVKGTWVTVDSIARMIGDGHTRPYIISIHPELTEYNIRVALGYYYLKKGQVA